MWWKQISELTHNRFQYWKNQNLMLRVLPDLEEFHFKSPDFKWQRKNYRIVILVLLCNKNAINYFFFKTNIF
jgi:hypothetical protein